jgi:hypothetical protein
MKEKLKIILFSILFVIIGFGLPYLIQFKWHFLGATLVTMQTIITVWLLIPLFVLMLLLLIYERI